jgi:hypothetical protein
MKASNVKYTPGLWFPWLAQTNHEIKLQIVKKQEI